MQNTTTKFSDYFTTKTRSSTGKEFVLLMDSAPQFMIDFVRGVHLSDFDGALPNDWIYSVIREAFEALEQDELDCIDYEPDVYNYDLIEWLKEPFALGFCEEVKIEGLIDTEANLINWIGSAQYLAKSRIYESVDYFIKERKELDEQNDIHLQR